MSEKKSYRRLSGRALAVVLLAVSPAAGIDITVKFDNPGANPSYDANGAKLQAIANAAAAYWEPLLPYSKSYTVTVHYEQLGSNPNTDSRLAYYNPIDGTISVRSNISVLTADGWFFDPTPNDHSEYQPLTSTLFRDLGGAEQGEFKGSPPGTLEVGFGAVAIAGNDASTRTDLYSVLLHEIGHMVGIGFNDLSPDVDIRPQWVGLRNGVKVTRADDAHVNPGSALMFPSFSNGRRLLPSALDIMVSANENNEDEVNLSRIDYVGNHLVPLSKDWTDNFAWAGGVKPNSFKTVFIRHGGEVTVLTTGSSADLTVSSGSTLNVAGTLKAFGDLDLRGGNATRLTVQNTGLVEVYDDLNNDTDSIGLLLLGGEVRVDGTLNNKGITQGHGTLRLAALDNKGTLQAKGGSLVLQPALAGNLFDYDGSLDNVNARLTAVDGDLDLRAAQADAFNGKITLASGRSIDLAGDFVIGIDGIASAIDDVTGPVAFLTNANGRIVIDGGRIEAQNDATLRVEAAEILVKKSSNTTPLFVGTDATLRLHGLLSFSGGDVFGIDHSRLELNGPTVVKGDTSIDVDHLDWDGNSNFVPFGPLDTTITNDATLSITAKTIDPTGSFNGAIAMGQDSTLDVHVTGGFGAFNLGPQSRLNFFGGGAVVGKSRVFTRGRIDAYDGDSAFDSDATLLDGAAVTLHNDATLAFNGQFSAFDASVTTESGQPDKSHLKLDNSVSVQGKLDVTVGYFAWDATPSGKSDTVIGPRAELNVRARRVGYRILTVAEDLGFGDKVTLNAGVLNIVLASGRGEEADTSWRLRSTGRMELNPVDGVLPVVKGSDLWSFGTITGTGRFEADLFQRGQLLVGHESAVGHIESGGTLTFAPTASTQFDLAGLDASNFDRVLVEDKTQLDGVLVVRLLDGFIPAPGDRFRILEGMTPDADVVGTFSSLVLPAIPAGYWSVNYTPSFVELAVIPEPAALVPASLGLAALSRRRRR